MSEKRILFLLLVAFVVLGAIYALTTPVFEASDELWHYPMVRHLADGNPLPVQVFDPAQAGPWKQEASQPPFYYYLGAALTFWIDTSDMPAVRRLNPHVDNGVVTADRNINLVVHDPALSPWQGTLLAVRVVRLASVFMGLVTVYLTYLFAREVAPGGPEIALGAAALTAFTPMFLFISGSVNNDNLAIMLATLALLMMVRIVRLGGPRAPEGLIMARWVGLGVVIGLATLTKEGTLGLIPLAVGAVAVRAWRAYRDTLVSATPDDHAALARRWGRVAMTALRDLALTLLPIVIIAGWWYYRNLALYGDWLGWNAFIAVLGQRPQPATLAQLWDERWGFLASYWGLFGGVNVPMATWIYAVLNGLLAIAVPGFLVYLWRTVSAWWSADEQRHSRTAGPMLRWLSLALDFIADHFALVICLLFSAAVVYGLINWATTTWSSQGRLVFTAISPLSILLALGLFGWLPRFPARIAAGTVGGFMFVIAAVAPIAWIAPAYRSQPARPATELTPTDVAFGERMRLTGYAIETPGDGGAVQPGQNVDVFLQWQVLATMERDWSVFVHLNDPVLQAPLAQRDMYPGGGLLATSFLQPGRTLTEQYRLQIPETAVAPAQLDLVVGLYDFQTHERLDGDMGDAVVLDSIALRAAQGERANALDVNLGRELALVGFDIDSRRVAAGDSVELVVSWKALRNLNQDYTLFAQVLNDEDTTRWAAIDLPAETSRWTAGAIQDVTMPLAISDDTPPGIYTVIVGAYSRSANGGFDRLQIVREGRISMEDAVQLARIRVDEQ
jgi:hypothetical protein